MPSHFGTGSEDYFGYAWGLGTPFHHPFIAQPIGEGNLTTGVTVNSRVRALDKIPFRKSLKFDMELWHWVKTSVNYAPATFFYMLPNGKCLDQPQVAEAKRKVARKRHDIIQPVADKNDIIEGESMICSHKEAKFSGSYSGNFSGGYLMRCFGIKENLTLSFHASEVQTTDLELKAIIHPQAGVFNVYLNKQLISSIGSLPKKKSMQTIRLKQAKIQKGENKLVFKFKENPSNNKEIDIDYIKILPTSKKSL